jgi:nitrate/TMAO reductase-like tetraheme cytochrome c subunit
MRQFWTSLWKMPAKWRWLLLPLGGWLALMIGALGWASFNGVMHVTSTNDFCYSCHIGSDTIVEEYQASTHFNNEHGFVATCADCHIPHEFVPKLITKIKATGDVYHQIAGTITLENFESHRPALAQGVWDDMTENDSRECRNCHSPDLWQTSLQSTRAQNSHNPAFWAEQDLTCISCHKGLAHALPQ